MSSYLTAEERFTDRLEIAGYFTSGLAAIILVVYFGMIFFYKPVQMHSLSTIGMTLLVSSIVLCLGFFIPRENNWARWGYCFCFYLIAPFSYFRLTNHKEWYFGLLLVYSVYILWVLTHPLSVRRFRTLRPWEKLQLPIGNWFTLHRILLALYSIIILLDGFLELTVDKPSRTADQGMLSVFLSLIIIFFLIFFRRMKNWARWCIALLCLGLGLTGIPAAINPQVKNYLEYWKSLLNVFYFLGLFAYLVFSPQIRKAFKSVVARDISATASKPV